MSDDIDFSKGERRKFYKPVASLNLPVHFDEDVRSVFSARPRPKALRSTSFSSTRSSKPGSTANGR